MAHNYVFVHRGCKRCRRVTGWTQPEALVQLPNASQHDLNCAVGIAYYAVFHAYCKNCADCLVGSDRKARRSPAWRQTYRAVEHGFSNKQCQNKTIMEKFPPTIQDVSNTYVHLHLQRQRHKADYDPTVNFTRGHAEKSIALAEKAARALESASLRDRRAFAVWMLMKHRP